MNGGGTMFGSPGSSSGSVFGTGLVNGSGGAGGGAGGVFGTPPTNNGTSWANFSGANPFSAAAGNSSSGGGGGWMNGGGSFGTAPQTQQGFGSVVQPSLFGTTPDPNFNQFSPSGPMNGTAAAAAAATTNNGAWASFSQQPPQQPQPNPKMQWMTSNGTANPFMAAPQLPSNGTSYNPFL